MMTSDNPKLRTDAPVSDIFADPHEGEDVPLVSQDRSFLLSEQTVKEMKAAGLPRPPHIPSTLWNTPKKLGHKHELIAFLIASGKSQTEVAQQLGYTNGRMSIICRAPRMQWAIERIRGELFGKDVKSRLQRLAPKGLDVIEGILDDGAEKAGVRLAAAKDVLDRAHGKPKETIEIQNNSIREVYDFLARAKADNSEYESKLKAMRKVTSQPTQGSDVIDAEVVEPTKPAFEAGIDSWIEENIPESAGIAVRKGQK